VYLDFEDAIGRLGQPAIQERYGNLFEMYERISGDSGYETPMMIYPAPHYTMGGLWVDYNLMSNIEGLFVLGEANFSDHGANRLGASALMQGLADGYFVAPYTIGNYLAQAGAGAPDPEGPAFQEAKAAVVDRTQRMLGVQGKRSARSIHIELGRIMWEYCGMARTDEGLRKALKLIPELREQFWNDVRVPGTGQQLNVELERAGRVADHLEFAELMCHDALNRDESCGGHFRVEHQTDEGEAKRDDENFSHVSVWENQGENNAPKKHKEDLVYESVKMATRSYK
jgi:succinate dehydrogenase / fumarate reductase flavoprotein subunit